MKTFLLAAFSYPRHLLCALLVAATSLLPAPCNAADQPAEPVPVMNAGQKKFVSITESGIQPKVVTLNQSDGSVFFVNRTKDSLLTLSIPFGKNRMHCASENLKRDKDGNLLSARPFGPHDFTLSCFPDKGSYHYTVSGIGARGKAAEGTVVVE